MFLTWSLRPFHVFNLVSQTLIFSDFEKGFMFPCFLVIMSSNDNALAPSTSAASLAILPRQHPHLDILRRASFSLRTRYL